MADNFGSIVHDINGTEIGEELCPIMFKATKKLYKIIGKNKAKSLKWLLEKRKKHLEDFIVIEMDVTQTAEGTETEDDDETSD